MNAAGLRYTDPHILIYIRTARARSIVKNNRRRPEMRFPAFATCFALFVELALGQSGGGAISGSVADPFGHPLAGAAVQARNGASGKDFKTTSSAKGGYALQAL